MIDIIIIIIIIVIIIIDKNHTVFKLSQLTSETSFVLLKVRRKKKSNMKKMQTSTSIHINCCEEVKQNESNKFISKLLTN